MSEVAKRLRDRRLNVWEQAKGIVTTAADENRALSSEEQGSYEAMMEELDNLDTRIKSVLDTEKRARDADAAFDAIAGKKPEQGRGPEARGDQELRSWLKGESPQRFYDLRPNGPVNFRTLSTLSSGAGGALAPTDFYDQLISHLIEVSGVMQAGPTVLNTAGGENLQIPKTTGHSTAASAAQASTLPSSDPAFGLATLSSYKYGVLLQVARELIDDSGVDLIGYLAMQAGRAIGNKFGADLVTGTGTSQPTGFMTSATIGVTGGNTTTASPAPPTAPSVAGGPTYSALVDLEYSVIAPYRQSRSCYWIARDATIGAFRKILDGQNRPIWEPSMVLGSPDLLLGKPLVADPFMPAIATGAQSIAFGDFSQFFVRMVGPVRFERSDDFLFGSDLVAFRAVLRGDGVLVDQTGAIKTFKGGAS